MTTAHTTGHLTTRDLVTDDLDAALDVRSRSFGPLDPSMRDWWNGVQQQSVDEHRVIGVFDGGRLLAHAKVRSYTQFWGGRPMPMGGVAGVVVAPDARGRGVGTRLMTALAQRSFELGDLVSTLYPATIPIYRALGWELVGAQHRISMSAEALRRLGGKDVIPRPATESDVKQMMKNLHDQYAARRSSGPRMLSEADIREQILNDGKMSYVADSGFVVYEWHGNDLVVSCLSADTPQTARALWSVVGSGSSIAAKVVAYLSPDDPIHHLLSQEVAHETSLTRWMLRVMDAQKAIEARGFPNGVTGSAEIAVEDPILPGNSGSWHLEVSGGRGALTPTAAANTDLRVGPNGFAALYSGIPVHVLRTAGFATGGEPAGDDLLDAAFAGRAAYLLEYF